ncbi:MAG: two-component sensor histidine kinase [Deltaproteobacteria bacterium]|nr:MAG: two-component sensor histidine kinase [Deltaproteobacteria bacterium]
MFLKNLLRVRNTLAFRLTLWYAGIFTFSACVAFLVFYLMITSVLRDRTDQELLSQVSTFSSIFSAKGLEAVKRVALLESQAAGERKIFFRLLYPDGITFSSSNMSYWQNIRVGSSAIRMLLEGRLHVFETMTIRGRKHKIRIIYSIIGPGVILQLGRSMENQDRIIEAFRKIFMLIMAGLFLVAVLIGLFMARRALAGVAEISRTARRISGSALDKRVPVKSRGDEIDQLAITFNRMLDRIETLVTGIREMNDNIAHDLKSPLTRIRGIAEITLTTDADAGDYESMAAGVIEECDRLLDIINTMLVISRTEAGVEKLSPEKLDLAEVVRQAVELFRPIAEDKNITMSCRTPDTLPYCGDIRMLQRMIGNLVDNALKYTSSGGSVDLAIGRDKEQNIIITVKDSGIGIAPEDQSHIFNRFFRCDSSRSLDTSRSGAGLGLSLCRAIVNAHGGDITVDSTPGHGSTFSITLPKSSI